ncbi:hypothetical protein HDU86_002370 [Geranomyces michiganensis]|nr:hypothetical protein HDU86_002370 [Geranomyces michiganensis]
MQTAVNHSVPSLLRGVCLTTAPRSHTAASSSLPRPYAVNACASTVQIRAYRGELLGHRPQPLVPKTEIIGEPSATPDLFKDTLPYAVKRTAKAGWLPIYRTFLKGNTQTITTIRRIEGNVQMLAKDLESIIPQEKITVKPTTGHVVLKGDYLFAVRDWLTVRKF